MELESFPVGRATQFANITELELGLLTITSGRLRVRDPFVPDPNDRDGCVLLVPPGEYRVWVTVAEIDDQITQRLGRREAYLSVALTDTAAARVASADALVAPPRPTYGALTGTDSATIAVFDDAIADIPRDGLCEALDAGEPLPRFYANYRLANGANVIASHTGYGDGAFPILATYTASGTPAAIHIDFCVLNTDDEEEDD